MYVSQITLPSQFNPSIYTPSFDTTGTAPANAVTGEQQTFVASQTGDLSFIMPAYAPFYFSTLSVKKVVGSNLVPMTPGVDYVICFPFLGASRAINQQVGGGIQFLDVNFGGTVQLAYQTLGGSWVTGQTKNAQILATVSSNPGVVSLEQAANYQTVFPVVTNAWDKTDTTSLSQVTAKLVDMVTGVGSKAKAQNYNAPVAHMANQNDPHQTTLAQVGLDKVANLPPATDIESQNITNAGAYINAVQVKRMMTDGTAKATPTSSGVIILDLASVAGDDNSQTKVLTAQSFTSLASNSSSAIGAAMNKGQIQGFITPFPYTFPVGWNGQIFYNQTQLNQAIQSYVGLTSLEYDSNLGCYWFPANTPIPSLVVTSSH